VGNAVPLFDETGSVCGAVGVFIDITERKQAEEKIRESERRYHELIHGLPVALYTTDADGYLTLYNEVASNLWGRRPVLGKDRWGGFSKVYKNNGIPVPLERSPMAIAIQENRRFKGDRELIGERPDGTYVTFLAHPMPFQDSTGKIVGAMNILVDISERKRSEDLLREQQEFLRAILNTASDAIITINAMGIIQSMNAATERMFGYTAAEIVGRNIKMLMPSPYREEDDDCLIDHGTTRVKKIIGIGREVTGRRKNGSTFPIDLAISEVVPFELFTGILRDITERKQAEQALRESMLFARATLDGLSAHIAILDGAGTILAVNQPWKDFAAANDAIPGSSEEGANYLTACDRSVGPNSKEASMVAAGIRAVLASETPEFVAEYPCHCSEGIRWFVVRVTPFPGDGPRRVVVAHEDVGRRKELEREVVEIASHEQRRIGQELHDGVGQELTALSMLTDDLTEILSTDPFGSSKLVEQISRKLKRAQQELRSVMLGLLPGPVDAQGLIVALADLADRIHKEGKVICHFDCPAPISLDDSFAATHLYLIAQEAVHNALKHARPKNIRISLVSNDVLALSVHDDGIGAQVKPAESLRGLGLRIMQNRAAIINATLIIEPTKPTGTLVTCTLMSKRHETKNAR
jgi:PAS domain S-box-containing protein